MWTASALASELKPYAGRVWRIVEAQHRISTNRLAASPEDQKLLEDLAEAVKPDLPREARGLHYLLASPFRYGHRSASRFRRADERPGIFYASEAEATAVAETAFWRLRFLSRSPGLVPPRTVSEHSSFSVALRLDRLIDLTTSPFSRDAPAWVADDYTACQSLAGSARQVSAQAVRSISARDPDRRCNLALLDPVGFADRSPRTGKTWHLRIEGSTLIALAAFPSELQFRFTAEQFGLTIG